LFTQTTPLAVHCMPFPIGEAQHIWPAPPHIPQLPPLHVPPMLGHIEPAAEHVPLTQQPPPQPFASQQGWPAAPHCAHTPPLPPPPWHT
jgi:hypothetical protein